MRFRLEIELRGLADPPEFDILILGQSDRDLGIGDIRDRRNKLEELVFDGS